MNGLPVSNYVPVTQVEPHDWVTITCDLVALVGDSVSLIGALSGNPAVALFVYGVSGLASTTGYVYTVWQWNEGDVTLQALIVTYSDTLLGLHPTFGIVFSANQLLYDWYEY